MSKKSSWSRGNAGCPRGRHSLLFMKGAEQIPQEADAEKNRGVAYAETCTVVEATLWWS
jgi:hypothetical protein